MLDALTDQICQCDFFRGLSPENCEQLRRVAQPEHVARHGILVHEGTTGRRVFLLREGRIQLSRMTEDGKEIVIRTMKPGELFGEVILFEQARYPVTATALTDCQVAAFQRADLLRLLDGREFRNDFIAALMQRQRDLVQRIQSLTACDVEERFRMFLQEQFGDAQTISTTISKKDMAAAIGATPETFSRLLQRLRASGEIVWTGKTLTLQRQPGQSAAGRQGNNTRTRVPHNGRSSS